jgi:inhibitor of KinA
MGYRHFKGFPYLYVMTHFEITDFNECSVLINFTRLPLPEANRMVMLLDAFCRENCHQWLSNQVPAYESLLLVAKNQQSISLVKEAVNLFFSEDLTHPPQNITTEIIIPVCYDVKLGNDLEQMEAFHRIGKEALINRHHQVIYHVYMLGFLPGFAYMGEVDERIATPRKSVPVHTRAGAVGIAGKQTGIYPTDSPGGWNIVGYTPLKMFEINKSSPTLLRPGNSVKFMPVDLETYYYMVKNGDGGL